MQQHLSSYRLCASPPKERREVAAKVGAKPGAGQRFCALVTEARISRVLRVLLAPRDSPGAGRNRDTAVVVGSGGAPTTTRRWRRSRSPSPAPGDATSAATSRSCARRRRGSNRADGPSPAGRTAPPSASRGSRRDAGSGKSARRTKRSPSEGNALAFPLRYAMSGSPPNPRASRIHESPPGAPPARVGAPRPTRSGPAGSSRPRRNGSDETGSSGRRTSVTSGVIMVWEPFAVGGESAR